MDKNLVWVLFITLDFLCVLRLVSICCDSASYKWPLTSGCAIQKDNMAVDPKFTWNCGGRNNPAS